MSMELTQYLSGKRVYRLVKIQMELLWAFKNECWHVGGNGWNGFIVPIQPSETRKRREKWPKAKKRSF